MLLGMFDGHADNMAVLVEFYEHVLVQVASFHDLLVAEIDKERIAIRKVLNSHFLNLPKSSVKKSIVNRQAVFEKHDAQILPAGF